MTVFKWNPADYSVNSQAQYKFASELITKFKLKGSETLLDIGCGDGKISARLSAMLPNGKVTGIDSSPEMIDFAQRNFSPGEYPNLRFILMDTLKLTFETEFDIVFSNAALHWVQGSHLEILKGVHRALKPGGRVFFQMGGKGNANDILIIVDELTETDRWKQYFRDFDFKYNFPSDKEYEEWLEAAELETVRAELIPKDMEQQGMEGLSAWFRTTWMPYLQQLPEKLKEDFISEVVTRYINKFPRDVSGKTHVAMMRLELEARRSVLTQRFL